MRSNRAIPLLSELPQHKLPDELQVLGYYLGQKKRQMGKYSPRKLAIVTAKAVKVLWDKSYIPCIKPEHIMGRLFSSKISLIKR